MKSVVLVSLTLHTKSFPREASSPWTPEVLFRCIFLASLTEDVAALSALCAGRRPFVPAAKQGNERLERYGGPGGTSFPLEKLLYVTMRRHWQKEELHDILSFPFRSPMPAVLPLRRMYLSCSPCPFRALLRFLPIGSPFQ